MKSVFAYIYFFFVIPILLVAEPFQQLCLRILGRIEVIGPNRWNVRYTTDFPCLMKATLYAPCVTGVLLFCACSVSGGVSFFTKDLTLIAYLLVTQTMIGLVSGLLCWGEFQLFDHYDYLEEAKWEHRVFTNHGYDAFLKMILFWFFPFLAPISMFLSSAVLTFTGYVIGKMLS